MVATKEIMKKFQKNLMKGKKKFNLHDMTPEYIVDTIIDIAATEEIKNILEIMIELGYRDKKTVRKYLDPLVKQGRIAMTIPDKPTSRNQKYITIK